MFSSKHCHLLLRNMVAITAPQRLAKISTGGRVYQADYYDALGVPKSSTQGEIKAAYYRLSMLYHPDKNKGSDTAATKFREITQAYEVLGNFKLRRLYDKGIIHTAGSKYAHTSERVTVYDTEPEPEDDPSTKFYKSRFKKSTVADSEGRTPIYNFDEWTREHYGKTFDRRQTAKSKFDREEARRIEIKFMTQNEILMVSLAVIGVLIYYKFSTQTSYDTPKEKAIRPPAEMKLNDKDNTT